MVMYVAKYFETFFPQAMGICDVSMQPLEVVDWSLDLCILVYKVEY